MWHLLTAHQQESFHPFPSLKGLSHVLSHMAKGHPKIRGSPCMDAAPGFRSPHQPSSAPPFPIPPTISYTCQNSIFFQLYWAAIVSLGRCGPVAWSQSSPSSHTRAIMGVGGGELPTIYFIGQSHSHPSGSRQGHSYLSYP